MAERNILLLMTGSIACAKATGLITAWRRAGHQVRVAVTPSVREFVGRATLEGLSGQAVFDDTFAPGQVMDHVDLARWADRVVACPATANTIAKFATGIADNAVTSLWQAAWGRTEAFVVPAMNTQMWRYPATQDALRRLREWGVHVLPVAEGDLACGDQGEGRMLECAEILAHLARLDAFARTHRPRRILVTGGGTREPLDAVRYIGNLSTGRTAAALCEHLVALGHDVTWLGAADAVRPGNAARQVTYTGFGDLDRQLRDLLGAGGFDGVVHAAAISDYSVAAVDGARTGAKLASGSELTVRLKPNPKLVARLREYAGREDLRVVGFKLTAGATPAEAEAAVQRLFAHARVDAVVHNDLDDISAVGHRFTWHLADGTREPMPDHAALAGAIANWIEGEHDSLPGHR